MQKFLEFVAEIFEVEVTAINEKTKYREFDKWDSLMMLRLVMEIEEEYDTEVPIDEIPNIKTLSDLYQYIQK